METSISLPPTLVDKSLTSPQPIDVHCSKEVQHIFSFLQSLYENRLPEDTQPGWHSFPLPLESHWSLVSPFIRDVDLNGFVGDKLR